MLQYNLTERSIEWQNEESSPLSFRSELVLEVLSGATCQAAVCRRHHLNENQRSQWKRQVLENASTLFGSTPKESSDAEQRITHLEQLVGRLTVALDMQKKVSLKRSLIDYQNITELRERIGKPFITHVYNQKRPHSAYRQKG